MNQVSEFAITGELPSGVTVLEASAGTGKTYTITSLTARYLAEGATTLDRMLLVTFTRLATGELRERVRERLIEVERGLAEVQAGMESTDAVVRLLCTRDPDRARARLRRAIAGYDAATIVTTHSFCQEMLDGLGIAAEIQSGYSFVEDIADMREEVVDDLYVRRFRGDPAPSIDLADARATVREAVRDETSAIVMPDQGVGCSGETRSLVFGGRTDLPGPRAPAWPRPPGPSLSCASGEPG
jgi:exodeoxyribonuclease V beta subunit